MKTKLNVCLMFLALFMFTACSTHDRQATIGQAQAYQVYYGTVSSIQEVRLNNDGQSTAGAVLGGVAGTALGNAIGDGSGRIIATALGGIAGALAGSAMGNAYDGKALEIIVNTDDGQTLSVVEKTSIQLSVGQRVRVMLGNNFSRVEPI